MMRDQNTPRAFTAATTNAHVEKMHVWILCNFVPNCLFFFSPQGENRQTDSHLVAWVVFFFVTVAPLAV